MINTAAAPFDDIRARAGAGAAPRPRQTYLDLIGARRDPRRRPALHPREPVLQPRRHAGRRRPGSGDGAATEYCASAAARPIRSPGADCTDGKINIELQFRGPSVIQTDAPRSSTRAGARRSTSTVRRAARGRAHPADRARSVQRQPVAPVRGEDPSTRQRVAAVPHDRRHLAQLAAVLRRGA